MWQRRAKTGMGMREQVRAENRKESVCASESGNRNGSAKLYEPKFRLKFESKFVDEKCFTGHKSLSILKLQQLNRE